jgi:hypothetical protein
MNAIIIKDLLNIKYIIYVWNVLILLSFLNLKSFKIKIILNKIHSSVTLYWF